MTTNPSSDNKKTSWKKKVKVRNERLNRGMLDEIELLKDHVRKAYTLDVRRKEGEELTPEELEIIEEQAFNTKLIARLEKIRQQTRDDEVDERKLNPNDVLALLRFFYIVRLSQQGFFYLVSSMFPAIEPQAVTYVADKLVGNGLYFSESLEEQLRKAYKANIEHTIQKLADEVDEPVGEGFKTTYKQIMQAVHRLSYQGCTEEKQADHSEGGETGYAKPATPQTTIPPIWVVMPYSSMMDGSTFAVPGTHPTLPFPSAIIPQGLMPQGLMPQFAYTQPAVPKKKRRNNKNRKNNNDKEKAVKEEEPKENGEEHKEKEDQKVDEEKEQSDNDDGQFEDHDDSDDGRFADPESSDEEEDSEEEETKVIVEDIEYETLLQQSTPVQNNVEVANTPKEEAITTAWKNFAASNTDMDTRHSNRSSPRSEKQSNTTVFSKSR